VHAGIDTHKDTLAVAVIDPAGRPVIVTDVANTEAGFDALQQLLERHAVTRVGIEGSGAYGRAPPSGWSWPAACRWWRCPPC
jgi:transposase